MSTPPDLPDLPSGIEDIIAYKEFALLVQFLELDK